jgi:hypothetical protein
MLLSSINVSIFCPRVVYVGQSGRPIITRHKEHIRYIRSNNTTSAYAAHILNNRHEYGTAENTLQLIKPCRKGKKWISGKTYTFKCTANRTDSSLSSRRTNPTHYTTAHILRGTKTTVHNLTPNGTVHHTHNTQVSHTHNGITNKVHISIFKYYNIYNLYYR